MDDNQLGWIAAIVIGGIAGWLAEQFMKSEMGILMNVILGVIGAAIAGAFELFWGSSGRMDRLPDRRLHWRVLVDLDRASGTGHTPASLTALVGNSTTTSVPAIPSLLRADTFCPGVTRRRSSRSRGRDAKLIDWLD